MPTGEIQIVSDIQAIAHAAARRIVEAAEAAVARRGRFSLVLSGGSTPKALYRHLAELPRGRIPWERVHIYFGDERAVPPDHPDSNYRMARETLLSHVDHPPEQVHRILAEQPPAQAAQQYDGVLRDHFPADAGPDFTLLGMGDDGHTASLFPDTAALDVSDRDCVANEVPRLKTWRITMTAPFLNRSDAVLFLVAGAGKASRLREVLEGPADPRRLPVQRIQPVSGRLTWLLDSDAGAQLRRRDAASG